MSKTQRRIVIGLVALILIVAWVGVLLYKPATTTETATAEGVTITLAVYTQEAFIFELLSVDGTKLGENARSRCANAATVRYDVQASDPYAWVIGFASTLGYIPEEGFDPKGDASMEAIILVLDKYTNGWALDSLTATPNAYSNSSPAVQEAATRVVARLGAGSIIETLPATRVPSSDEVKNILALVAKKV
ncbi:MAG: hypothetical protein LBE03_00770 [Candidatus Nomurabacteria bacterium]|nr:hypothetical protein [Candidatus Nomurabacteria bacterium]